MPRLTEKNDVDGKYYLSKEFIVKQGDQYVGDAVEKLAKLENLYENLKAEQIKLSNEMAKLKAENKTKSVKFKELMVKKLNNNTTIIHYEINDLN